jgi:hypothetical protein
MDWVVVQSLISWVVRQIIRKQEELILAEQAEKIFGKAELNAMYPDTIRIPEGYTEVNMGDFYEYMFLRNFHIPASVTKITGNNTSGFRPYFGKFHVDADNPAYCVVDGVLYNKDRSVLFNYSSDETTFVVPDSVTELADGAFSHDIDLLDITIPDSVTRIGKNCFRFCKLTHITIPDSVIGIGGNRLTFSSTRNTDSFLSSPFAPAKTATLRNGRRSTRCRWKSSSNREEMKRCTQSR